MILNVLPAVPGAPQSVVLLDIGPTSVRVEWSPETLPSDDGGSPLTTIRLTYRAMENGTWPGAWSSKEVVMSVQSMHAVVSDLSSMTTYQIRMEVRSEIGKHCDMSLLSTLYLKLGV